MEKWFNEAHAAFAANLAADALPGRFVEEHPVRSVRALPSAVVQQERFDQADRGSLLVPLLSMFSALGNPSVMIYACPSNHLDEGFMDAIGCAGQHEN